MSTAKGPLKGRAARLGRLMPSGPSSAARTPFVLLVVVLLGGGLISLLLLNSALNQGSFQLNELKDRTTELTDEEQALQRDVDDYAAPDALERRARELGMVPGGSPAFLGPDGKVLGEPSVAVAPKPSPTPKPTKATPKPPSPTSTASSAPPSTGAPATTDATRTSTTTEPRTSAADAGIGTFGSHANTAPYPASTGTPRANTDPSETDTGPPGASPTTSGSTGFGPARRAPAPATPTTTSGR
ncbi:septum formation initiator family protein [Streptomyces zaomyceticus]|uniref:FtsB family cell division protein n=1 Tax=Streptomyces zaomyceticus TaxID=68286 RepID=UPI002E0DF859|nr:septum formation initiator family protein [Streptomyces zaomyceticus]